MVSLSASSNHSACNQASVSQPTLKFDLRADQQEDQEHHHGLLLLRPRQPGPADGEAPAEGGENGEAPAEGAGGFMGGIMGKANALKAKAAETAAAAGAGNLQSMAGGVM